MKDATDDSTNEFLGYELHGRLLSDLNPRARSGFLSSPCNDITAL